jgi:peptide deformylase
MVLELVKDGHRTLLSELEDFDFRNPPTDPIELANNLIETMKYHKGIGLSANQCGLPYRAFALWSAEPLVVFNPRVVDQTSEFVELEEGCLTYPNLYIKIKRPKSIKVRFQDAFGETHTEKYIGMTARGFLHEMDHLDGVLFMKRAAPMQVTRAWSQKKKLDRQLKRGEVYYKPSDLPNVKITGTENENTNI